MKAKSEVSLKQRGLQPVVIPTELIDKAANCMRALRHPMRRQIIEMLADTTLTVTEIYTALKVEQSVCSQQLAILRRAGVVKTERSGKCIYYLIDGTAAKQIAKAVELFPAGN